jgi:hypothetical protein
MHMFSDRVSKEDSSSSYGRMAYKLCSLLCPICHDGCDCGYCDDGDGHEQFPPPQITT